MEKEYQELVSEFAVLQEDSKIQTGHLKRILTAKEKKVTELLEQLKNEHQEAKRYRDNLMLQHSKEMQEMRERIEKLKSENKMEGENILTAAPIGKKQIINETKKIIWYSYKLILQYLKTGQEAHQSTSWVYTVVVWGALWKGKDNHVHSSATLLGTHLQLLFNTNI